MQKDIIANYQKYTGKKDKEQATQGYPNKFQCKIQNSEKNY